MTFAQPHYLYLLLLLLPLAAWHFLVALRHRPSLRVASMTAFEGTSRTWRTRLVELPFLLRALVLVFLALALARPQTHTAFSDKETEGIDIMMAMDISTSMLTPDLRPNRIEAAKRVANEFISNRPHDNIGLTLFAGEAFTQCPLTQDHAALLHMFKAASCDLQAQGIIGEGTAIGMGISSAVAHLERSEAKSKVVILLTDGENNAGDISPLMAADLARQLGVRVYTILLGTDNTTSQAVATLPDGREYYAPVASATDPTTLREIARQTGGLFYQAGSNRKLREIYEDIDRLEKSKLKVINYDRHYEAFQLFALLALCCLLAEVVLRLTWFRRIP